MAGARRRRRVVRIKKPHMPALPDYLQPESITNRKLVIAILVVLITWLAFLASALVMGLLSPPAPRTAVERSIGVYGAAVDEGTTDAMVWSDYIAALVAGEQYSAAERAIGQALESVTEERSLVLGQLASLRFEQREWEEAVGTAEDAIEAARQEWEAKSEEFRSRGIVSLPDPAPALAPAQLIQARALAEQGEYEAAVVVLDEYLDALPTASDVLVLRAGYKTKYGDITGAAEDYRQALVYIPDYEEALDGLEDLLE